MKPATFAWRLEFGHKDITMTVGAKILSVAMKDGRPHLYALVDWEQQTETRRFTTVKSGYEIPLNFVAENFIGTVHDEFSAWHVFEVFGEPVWRAE